MSYDPDAILADPNAHPKHKAIAAINIRVRDFGEHWAKCVNCGEPYQVLADGNGTVCSDQCGDEFIRDLVGPLDG